MYTPKNTAEYEAKVRAEGVRAMGARPPMVGPVCAEIVIVMPVPKSYSKAKRAAALAGEILPDKKPDIDNVMKAVLDALNGVVYHDDAQVTDSMQRKRFGEVAHVQVTFTQIPNVRGV